MLKFWLTNQPTNHVADAACCAILIRSPRGNKYRLMDGGSCPHSGTALRDSQQTR